MWERKFQSTNARRFDVLGHHANVVPGYGTPEKGWDYAIKDGDVVGGGLVDRPGGDGVGETRSKWSEIIASESAEQFWDACARLDPRSLCCSFVSLEKYVAHRYRPVHADYVTPDGISFDTGRLVWLDDWARDNIGGHCIGNYLTPSLCSSGGGSPQVGSPYPPSVTLRSADSYMDPPLREE